MRVEFKILPLLFEKVIQNLSMSNSNDFTIGFSILRLICRYFVKIRFFLGKIRSSQSVRWPRWSRNLTRKKCFFSKISTNRAQDQKPYGEIVWNTYWKVLKNFLEHKSTYFELDPHRYQIWKNCDLTNLVLWTRKGLFTGFFWLCYPSLAQAVRKMEFSLEIERISNFEVPQIPHGFRRAYLVKSPFNFFFGENFALASLRSASSLLRNFVSRFGHLSIDLVRKVGTILSGNLSDQSFFLKS